MAKAAAPAKNPITAAATQLPTLSQQTLAQTMAQSNALLPQYMSAAEAALAPQIGAYENQVSQTNAQAIANANQYHNYSQYTNAALQGLYSTANDYASALTDQAKQNQATSGQSAAALGSHIQGLLGASNATAAAQNSLAQQTGLYQSADLAGAVQGGALTAAHAGSAAQQIAQAMSIANLGSNEYARAQQSQAATTVNGIRAQEAALQQQVPALEQQLMSTDRQYNLDQNSAASVIGQQNFADAQTALNNSTSRKATVAGVKNSNAASTRAGVSAADQHAAAVASAKQTALYNAGSIQSKKLTDEWSSNAHTILAQLTKPTLTTKTVNGQTVTVSNPAPYAVDKNVKGSAYIFQSWSTYYTALTNAGMDRNAAAWVASQRFPTVGASGRTNNNQVYDPKTGTWRGGVAKAQPINATGGAGGVQAPGAPNVPGAIQTVQTAINNLFGPGDTKNTGGTGQTPAQQVGLGWG